jgi:hypothetical protein
MFFDSAAPSLNLPGNRDLAAVDFVEDTANLSIGVVDAPGRFCRRRA